MGAIEHFRATILQGFLGLILALPSWAGLVAQHPKSEYWQRSFESYLTQESGPLTAASAEGLLNWMGSPIKPVYFYQSNQSQIIFYLNERQQWVSVLWSSQDQTKCARSALRGLFDDWLGEIESQEEFERWQKLRASLMSSYIEASRSNSLEAFHTKDLKITRKKNNRSLPKLTASPMVLLFEAQRP